MTSFLFLHSAGAVALAILLGLTGTILGTVAMCKAIALGQRPMNEIVRDAEDRRQQNRRQEDRIVGPALVHHAMAGSAYGLLDCCYRARTQIPAIDRISYDRAETTCRGDWV